MITDDFVAELAGAGDLAGVDPAFVSAARAFLESHAPPRTASAVGSAGRLTIMADTPADEERRSILEARAWRRTLFDGGFGWIDGPHEFGGAGLGRREADTFRRLEECFDVPDQSCFLVGLSIVAPAIRAHGTDEQRHRYLRGLYRADLFACQLFSEPEHGSDLAGVSTRAVPDGEEWRVNGQKVWNSGAQFSDVGLLLARTDPTAPKHKGLTMFLIDMDQPGVEVRPLRQMTGGSHFNEVFLVDAVVPEGQRLGDRGEGWSVAITTLMSEREAVGSSQETPATEVVDHLLALLERRAASGARRSAVLEAVVLGRTLDLTGRRLHEASAGRPGPEMSIVKLLRNQFLAAAVDAGCTVEGPGAAAGDEHSVGLDWGRARLALPGLRIAGGTDEIQRNILAERVLGLPREPLAAEARGPATTGAGH